MAPVCTVRQAEALVLVGVWTNDAGKAQCRILCAVSVLTVHIMLPLLSLCRGSFFLMSMHVAVVHSTSPICNLDATSLSCSSTKSNFEAQHSHADFKIRVYIRYW